MIIPQHKCFFIVFFLFFDVFPEFIVKILVTNLNLHIVPTLQNSLFPRGPAACGYGFGAPEVPWLRHSFSSTYHIWVRLSLSSILSGLSCPLLFFLTPMLLESPMQECFSFMSQIRRFSVDKPRLGATDLPLKYSVLRAQILPTQNIKITLKITV